MTGTDGASHACIISRRVVSRQGECRGGGHVRLHVMCTRSPVPSPTELDAMAGQKLLYDTYARMERRIAPGLRYSQDEYEAQLYRYVDKGTTWLDLGCGRRLLPAWRAESERQLVARAQHVFGIDLDLDSLRDGRDAKDASTDVRLASC